MTKRTFRAAALAMAASALCAACYAQVPTTRQQVQQELADAIRNGDMISGESGLPLREQFPGQYPQAIPRVGKSRAQVREELAQAIRNGDMIAGGEIALRRSDGVPGAFGNELMVGARTRAQVKSELAEAIRTGDIDSAGEIAMPRNQLAPTLYANVPAPMVTASEAGESGGETAQ